MSKFVELEYQVSFNTPAFLGNASNHAQWRTPPFKALLRHWWRVASAKKFDFNYPAMLIEENKLFGNALSKDDSCRSQVQLRLSDWGEGKGGKPKSRQVMHPEVKQSKVEAATYLGYGPIKSMSTVIEASSDGANKTVTLRLRLPIAYKEEIEQVMQLIAWFGTIGGRSRNGWGSLLVKGNGIVQYDSLSKDAVSQYCYLNRLEQALKHDWVHSIALCEDNKPAIWRLEKTLHSGESVPLGFNHWDDVIGHLAELKIQLRTSFKLGRPGPFEERHFLAYPVTNHVVDGLGNKVRIPNQLRFKVVSHNNKYYGLIFHLPCKVPSDLFKDGGKSLQKEELQVWQAVHHYFNNFHRTEKTTSFKLTRI